MLKNQKNEKNIPFFKPTIDSEELSQVQEVLKNEFTTVSKVDELEKELSEFIGAKYAIATNNATSSLHLALSAIDLKRADKVLMSVNSFPNLPETVRHFDAEPIFLDFIPKDILVGAAMQQPYLMGQNAVYSLDDHINGKNVEKNIQLPILAISKDNIEKMIETLLKASNNEACERVTWVQ